MDAYLRNLVTAMEKSPLLERLERLDRYIGQDPSNETLLADAHETAVQAHAFDQAEQYLQLGYELSGHGADWQLREAASWIAQKRYPEAKQRLLGLQIAMGPHPVVAHELASIAFHEGSWEECQRIVEGIWTQPTVASDDAAASIAMRLAAMWLRAGHQLGLIEDCIAWAEGAEASTTLGPYLAGIASLIAVDGERFDLGLRWADEAIRFIPFQREAFNAKAALALAQKDFDGCKQLAAQCLERNRDDGRAWSTLGLVHLLEQDLPRAVQSLQQAVVFMPTHIGSWHALAWAHLVQREFDDALKAFDEALALDRNFGESHGGKAVVLVLMGQHALARHHADLASGLDAQNLSGRFAVAILSGETFDSEKFNRLAEQLLTKRAGFFGDSALDWVKSVPKK